MKSKRKLKRRSHHPRRRLNDKELREAAILCFENASDLLTEAQLLLSNDHKARASALAAVGFEELSKARVCAALLAKHADFAMFEEWEVFWDFWINHVEKGTWAFLRTAQDDNLAIRFSDQKRAIDLGKSLKDIRERGLYVDVWENKNEGERPAELLPPREALNPRSAEWIVTILDKHLANLSPTINELREARIEDAKRLAATLVEYLETLRMRPVTTAADFPEPPTRPFEVVVYGSDNPFLLRALSAHYGVEIKGWRVESGKAERSLDQVLADLRASGRELLVRGPGNVVIDVVVGTDPSTMRQPGPVRFGIAFYEQRKHADDRPEQPS